MRVLVTGGAGYIGSHVCKALAEAGYKPVVYDNLSSGHEDAVKWGPLVKGDILDSHELERAFIKYRPDSVLHFAAFAYVGESVADPAKYYRTNVIGSWCLLDAMQRCGVKKIILSSTCATYGIPQSLPITEETPQAPINPYGFTKLAVERMLADYQSAYGLSWVAMRYFNAAGCDPSGELGERHTPETHVVPLAILAALGKSPAMKVFGSDYDTPDGTAIRDYIHVNDLASAHVGAIAYLSSGGSSRAFNLATGQGTSVLQILDAVTAATGRRVPVVHAGRRAGDPAALYADARPAKEILNWTPQIVDVKQIVGTAADWFIKNHNI